MALEVPVIIHNRREHTKLQLNVGILEQDTVRSVTERISEKTGIERSQLSAVLCGRVLDESTKIKELLLGPTTSLIVLVVDQKKPENSSKGSSDSSQIGSFYLWCKACDDVTRGKLRVYCSSCSGSAVVVKSEPNGWEDVLISKRITLHCEVCDSDTFAIFKFKCVKCNGLAAPLSQVRGNWEQASCLICAEENEKFMFDLGCNHPVCRDCFRQYVETSLNEGNFTFRSPYGYTIGCVYAGCECLVRDAHHFCILGQEKYKRYQQLATEKLVALHDQGVFCPYPDCSAYFFWEMDNEDGKTYCPSCYRHFCRNCKSRECTCTSEEDLNRTTIEATTKKCPGCNVNTERNGGCLHVHCTSCGTDWCFRCERNWSDECQWDHWFG